MQREQGFAQHGNATVWTAGRASTNVMQESHPYALVAVHSTGTTTTQPRNNVISSAAMVR